MINKTDADNFKKFEEGYNIVIEPNWRILNPKRVKELYIVEGEAVTWGGFHYIYIMNEVINNRKYSLIVVNLMRENAGADWKLRVTESNALWAMSPLKWIRRAQTPRWPEEDFEIHYELLDGIN